MDNTNEFDKHIFQPRQENDGYMSKLRSGWEDRQLGDKETVGRQQQHQMVRGCWDGCATDKGCCCGIVVKAVVARSVFCGTCKIAS